MHVFFIRFKAEFLIVFLTKIENVYNYSNYGLFFFSLFFSHHIVSRYGSLIDFSMRVIINNIIVTIKKKI